MNKILSITLVCLFSFFTTACNQGSDTPNAKLLGGGGPLQDPKPLADKDTVNQLIGTELWCMDEVKSNAGPITWSFSETNSGERVKYDQNNKPIERKAITWSMNGKKMKVSLTKGNIFLFENEVNFLYEHHLGATVMLWSEIPKPSTCELNSACASQPPVQSTRLIACK